MEVINYIILITLVVNLILTVFLYILFINSNKKVSDLTSIINKMIMGNEESKRQLSDFVASQSTEIISSMNEVSKDVKMQIGYQKSYIEGVMADNKKDMEQMKDRLEYLSTEVNID